jgi:DNA-(apurinic or apyrimidinic site) lyase
LKDKTHRLSDVLCLIPWQKWEKIIGDEPEKLQMYPVYSRYPFGAFAVTMIMVGLNDFQLKGKADVVYWPKIHHILANSEIPASPDQMISILRPFYLTERLNQRKASRLDRFLKSELAGSLWGASAPRVAQKFATVWVQLSMVMNQDPQAKTIVFAMKCLGISLLMAREYDFDFSRIPIPVDSRIETLTRKVAPEGPSDRKGIQRYWSEVLVDLRKVHPQLSMIHLDSLCWQIGTLGISEIRAYFERLGLIDLGDKIIKLIKAEI